MTDPKGVTTFSTADDVRFGPGPVAASHSSRTREAQDKLREVKAQQLPVAGGPIDKDKMAALSGVGSAYKVNQAMASGELERPVSVAEAANMEGRSLSQETVTALQMARQSAEEAQTKIDEKEREMVDERSSVPFDFEELMRFQNPLMKEERRKEIESRLGELKIEDLIMRQEMLQTVPVIEGRFNVTVRTISQREHLWILQYLYEHPGSERYVEELFSTMKLVCSVVSINGRQFPDHRKNVGTRQEVIDRDAFKEKMSFIEGLPVQLVADLGVQVTWFNDRVNRLFSFEDLKNG